MLDVRGLETFYGDSQILFGVNLTVAAGEVVALLGRNGMGKTTMLNSIVGLVKPRAGRVVFQGHDVTGQATYRIAQRGIGLVPQELWAAPADHMEWLGEAQGIIGFRLFELGGQIGPDLTAYQRDDLDTMLLSIINPGAEIREGYENFLLTTNDGRLATGFLVEQDNRSVVLRGFDGQDAIFDRGEIRELKAQGASLMPGG